MNIFGINAAGIKSKTKSFNEILKRLKPKIWMLQETKLNLNETILCEALNTFQVFYLNRQETQGGGLALGVANDVEATLIREGDDEVEAISVKIVIGDIPIRLVVAYGPQENAKKEKKDKFWDFLEQEVNQAELEETGLIIQMDGNLHAGPGLIKNDPNPKNLNGRIFLDFLQRNQTLTVVNALKLCEGIITRMREFESRTEKAILDFFIVNEKMVPFINTMKVDEDRNYPLSNFAQIKKNGKVVETDHNGLILEMNINVSQQKPDRVEIFNLKNKLCQDAFKAETEHNVELLESFNDDLPDEVQCKKWFKNFNNILHKCFKKVRIVENKKKSDDGIDNIIRERIKLKRDSKSEQLDETMKDKINVRIAEIETEVGDHIAKEFLQSISDTIKEVGGEIDDINGSGRNKIWKLMKKKYPKQSHAIPVGKRDRSGNMITNHAGLKHLYLETYLHRLRNRPIKGEFEEIKDYKTELFNLRMQIVKNSKTEPWNLDELEKALKSLKNKKARDPHGWVNELFNSEITGKNLKMSLLKLFNKVKESGYIPDFMEIADIATIYKGKGDKFNLENDRGIFIVTILRSILMKLIYNDEYKVIDNSMSDSQIGARKGKNIRNHIWLVNGVICDVLSRKVKKPIDIHIYDYKQCFDSLWLEESLNDFFDGGLRNDKLSLLYNVNRNVKVVVKTPAGKTEKGNIQNVITQGDIFGALLCSKQVDSFGKECLEDHKYTYMYKGEVEIPPLAMVDDLLCISECGYKTQMLNTFMKVKTNTKKLQFGEKKCKKLHIGKYCEDFKCQDISVDCWNEITVFNEEVGMDALEDKYVGEIDIEEKSEEKYLGDLISNDGRNLKNLKTRVEKGKGIVNKILSILDAFPFGSAYFEIGLILRNSLLVSSMLCNSEAWYNITNSELCLIESIDEMLLRRLLNAPKSTPKEMMYLELGCLPYRDIIQKRRLMFLYYILNQDQKSIMFKFFESQRNHGTSKDWVTTIRKDLKELQIDLNFDKIKSMGKHEFKKIVKQKIENKAKLKLEEKKASHSKVMHLKHESFGIQKYLKPTKMQISIEERQLIFKLRSKVTNVKMNFRGMHEELTCDVCQEENETQEHVLECKEINKNDQDEIEYAKIDNGNVCEMVKIARRFRRNIKIRDKT